MSKLANMFSVLHLDGEDDGEDDRDVTQTSSTNVEGTAAVKPGVQNDETLVNKNGGSLASSSSGGYSMPLVWIDLEMTGLDILKDRILEIACILTDGKLTKQIEGPDLVISQSKDCLENMGEWCKTNHASSGLTERVLKSEISEHDAEKQEAAVGWLCWGSCCGEEVAVQKNVFFGSFPFMWAVSSGCNEKCLKYPFENMFCRLNH